MSQNNAARSVAYDNASAVARQFFVMAANGAGSGNPTSKFYAATNLIVWGVTFCPIVAGTSTYTVAGTATNPATQMSAIYVTNTSTATVGLATSTVGPFTVGGTGPAGSNVSLGGLGGGVAGGVQGPYALNTLGGTNTSQTWGTNTFLSNAYPPGAPGVGLGGLPMQAGDVLYFVNGTDATSTTVAAIQYSVSPSGPLVS